MDTELCEQLTRLVYELLDAHDDTAKIAAGSVSDDDWEAHLHYLRDLQRVGFELLATAPKTSFPAGPCTLGWAGIRYRINVAARPVPGRPPFRLPRGQ